MSKKKYTFTMVVVKPTGKGGKPLKPKEIKPKNKSTGGQMLKGGQKKLDKNKDGKISGEDFKMMKAKKGAMVTGKKEEDDVSKYVKSIKLPDAKDVRDIVKKKAKGGEMKQGYGAARQSGMGLQDENLVPGKSMDYYKDLM
jgi:hypothetical protein